MQDANKFNEDLIKGLALELHKGMNYLSAEFNKKLDDLRIEVGKQIADLRTEVGGQITDLKTEVGGQIADLKFELKFDMNQMETRLTHRVDDLSTKVDRIDRELTSFRKDTTGQFHEVRATLLRIDEKSSYHEERLISLERAVNTKSS